uniref:Uncharacterized protein n=1 Tax=Anguilla anguilla TaxID=7936 RepID=A0A0E9RDW3_ANGAN
MRYLLTNFLSCDERLNLPISLNVVIALGMLFSSKHALILKRLSIKHIFCDEWSLLFTARHRELSLVINCPVL